MLANYFIATFVRFVGLIPCMIRPSMENERLTIEKIIAGDAKAFKQLVEDHQKLVAHIVFKMVSNPSDQQEICQEVFIKVYENLRTFQFNAKLSTWIARIAYNTTLNHIAKKKTPLYEDYLTSPAEEENYASADQNLSESLWDEPDMPDAVTQNRETARVLKEAIQSLAPQYRTIVTLFHMDDMSYAEIGEIMQMPEGTVKSYLFRARKMLKARLLENFSTEELI